MATRTCRCRPPGGVLLAVAVAAAVSTAAGAARQPPPTAACERTFQASRTTHRYTLAARVRPLLFWISKDNVGEAHLTWLVGEDGKRGYRLLIGSDPTRAPRKVNRWGYVTETEEETGVRVLGLMTQADERSLEQARSATGQVPKGTQVFKIIHATIAGDTATAAVQGLALSDRLTFRDLDAVIALLPGPSAAATVPVPAGTEPGFLFAMTSLMRENVDAAQETGRPPVATRRSYVFANKLYSVATRSSRLLKRATIKERQFEDVIDSEFEARAATRGKGDRFRVVYGTEGALRAVPVRIVYRPNWWFEAEVVLIDH